ncbi:hypothetical protein K5X82_03640 [Halosquirtibacter xylanolyticus]|uniref:hypothetical protein n=1 Tax=Halosquirtibacter xylanolyticus TaxID=3374599 RepID=UPI003748274E|nr:hypothetical protein K5X82_03640 [Prolixibacteraceae bacterium]
MKKTLLTFILLVQGVLLFAQKHHGVIKNGEFVWEKVYKGKRGLLKNKRYLTLNLTMYDLREYSNRIAYEMDDVFLRCNSVWSTFNNTVVSGHVMIDFKDDDYRVMITKVRFKKFPENLDNITPSYTTFEKKYMNRKATKFKSIYHRDLEERLNLTFDVLFTMPSDDESWTE